MDPLPRLVLRAVSEYRLWSAGERIVVGVSGGPDSTALLACLLELPAAVRPDPVAAHLDHGLRPRAASEAQWVAGLAQDLGVPFVGGRARPLAAGTSREAAARTERYRFLAEVAGSQGCRTVAVGHHRDDQVETILLRLLRGAGSRGLSAMRPSAPLPGSDRRRLTRPLWFADRGEVMAFLRARELAWLEDETNGLPAYALRNRIRHEVLPVLERQGGGNVRAAIWRSAANLAEDDAALSAWTAAEARGRLSGTELRWSGGFTDLPSAIRVRLVQAWWEGVTGRPPLGRRVVENLLRLRPGASLDLPAGHRAAAEVEVVRLAKAQSTTPPSAPHDLDVPGSLCISGVGRISARVVEYERAGVADGRRRAVADPTDLALPLLVRPARPGERVRTGRAGGRRALRDMMREAGLGPVARTLPRVVTDRQGRALWVAGVRAIVSPPAGPRPSGVLLLVLEGEDSGPCAVVRRSLS